MNSENQNTPRPWFDWKKREWIHEPKKLLANYEDACLIAAAPELVWALELQMPWKMRDGTPCCCAAGEKEGDDDQPKKMRTVHSSRCEESRTALAHAKGKG